MRHKILTELIHRLGQLEKCGQCTVFFVTYSGPS